MENVNAVKRWTSQSHILLNTPEEVDAAFRVYGGDVSQSALTVTSKDIDISHGAMGGALFAFAMTEIGGGKKSFASRCGAEAGKCASENRRWHGDWDYDGPGPFHKCSITVQPFDIAKPDGTTETKFGMEIWAAYVGGKPEAELAEIIDRPRGLNHIEITRSCATPEGSDRARIPWSAIEAAYAAAGAEPPTPEAFIEALTLPARLKELKIEYETVRGAFQQLSDDLAADCKVLTDGAILDQIADGTIAWERVVEAGAKAEREFGFRRPRPLPDVQRFVEVCAGSAPTDGKYYDRSFASQPVVTRDGYEVRIGLIDHSVEIPWLVKRDHPERDAEIRFEDDCITLPAAMDRKRRVETIPNPRFGKEYQVEEEDPWHSDRNGYRYSDYGYDDYGERTPKSVKSFRRSKDDGGRPMRLVTKVDRRETIEVEVDYQEPRAAQMVVTVDRANRVPGGAFSEDDRRIDHPVFDRNLAARMMHEADRIEEALRNDFENACEAEAPTP